MALVRGRRDTTFIGPRLERDRTSARRCSRLLVEIEQHQARAETAAPRIWFQPKRRGEHLRPGRTATSSSWRRVRAGLTLVFAEQMGGDKPDQISRAFPSTWPLDRRGPSSVLPMKRPTPRHPGICVSELRFFGGVKGVGGGKPHSASTWPLLQLRAYPLKDLQNRVTVPQGPYYSIFRTMRGSGFAVKKDSFETDALRCRKRPIT